jgi:hypothetical protein
MCWCAVPIPPSVMPLLPNWGKKGFSKVQALMAILDWFAALPPDVRADLAYRYLHEQATSAKSDPAAAS